MSEPTLPPELALEEPVPEYVDQWLAGEGEPLDPAVDLWLCNDERAEWAMRDLVRAQLAIIETHQQAEAWHRRIQAWYDEQTETPVRQVERLTAQLQRYGIARREVTGVATVHLPSGRVGTRRETEPRVEITDPKAVLVWAKDNGDVPIKTTEEVLVTALREHVHIVTIEEDAGAKGDRFVVDEDGNVVPGVAIIDPTTTASVTPRHE